MNAQRQMLIASLVFVAHAAHAELRPAATGPDPRVRHVIYAPEEVVRLEGVVGYHLHLRFAPGERFVNLGAGDGAALEVATQDEHLFLKPKAPLVATNLTVLTNLRVYTFAYRARATAPGEAGEQMWAVQFDYPSAAPASATATPVTPVAAAMPAAPAVLPEPPPPPHDRYGFCGAHALRPRQVYDDGVQTHFRFARGADIPAIFAVGSDGTEGLVNFHVDTDEVVVHQRAPRFVLRRGRAVACVVRLPDAATREEVPRGP